MFPQNHKRRSRVDGPLQDWPEFLRVFEVAEVLQLSQNSVYALIKANAIPTVHFGKSEKRQIHYVPKSFFVQMAESTAIRRVALQLSVVEQAQQPETRP